MLENLVFSVVGFVAGVGARSLWYALRGYEVIVIKKSSE